MQVYNVLGLMSGTSLDGVDLALCQFRLNKKWEYNIINARTYDYPRKWVDILSNVHELSARLVADIDQELGTYYGHLIKNFIEEYQLTPDFVSSHGHTIFHRPEEGVTLQAGNGGTMANICKLNVVNDFRKNDVLLGGQGAPLVPIGDQLLFSEYDACLNLGGFANVSHVVKDKRLAFDICPVNMALNEVAKRTGNEYDDGGDLARAGEIQADLLEQLDSLDYYQRQGPRSLGKEWYSSVFRKVMNKKRHPPVDLLATLVEHIAKQISTSLNSIGSGRVLVTGGGVYNRFLMQRIQQLSMSIVIMPEKELIEFKEALIFAFLGVLRVRNEVNVLSSVTGSEKDHCSGIVHKP